MENDLNSLKNFIVDLRAKRGDGVATLFLVGIAVSLANTLMRALNDAVERGEFDDLLRLPHE